MNAYAPSVAPPLSLLTLAKWGLFLSIVSVGGGLLTGWCQETLAIRREQAYRTAAVVQAPTADRALLREWASRVDPCWHRGAYARWWSKGQTFLASIESAQKACGEAYLERVKGESFSPLIRAVDRAGYALPLSRTTLGFP